MRPGVDRVLGPVGEKNGIGLEVERPQACELVKLERQQAHLLVDGDRIAHRKREERIADRGVRIGLRGILRNDHRHQHRDIGQ